MFTGNWNKYKTPTLQIAILKLIIMTGGSSKKKVAKELRANYPDVSDSMKDLEERKFIRFSKDIVIPGHNREKFYNITEVGLRALLTVKLDVREFWSAITLLCICSKSPLDKQEFEDYFNKFEHEFLGHSNIHGYFFMTDLFDDIHRSWLKFYGNTNIIPAAQKIIEYLAFNGPTHLKQLVKETGSSKEEVDKFMVRDDISFQNVAYDNTNPNLQSRSDTNAIYSKLVLHLLLNTSETRSGTIYELTLFGVILAIAIITYQFVRVTDVHGLRETGNTDISSKRPKLFYDNIDLKRYFDKIAQAYKDKIPLIFSKWSLLQSQLGTMLYDSFDFLIWKPNRAYTIDETIWSFGTKEYYYEIKELANNTIKQLYVIFLSGKATIKGFEDRQKWIINDSRMKPIYDKLYEAEVIMKYANIAMHVRNSDRFSRIQSNKQQFLKNMDIQIIENMFEKEMSFLFYLSLNTMFLPGSYKRPSPGSIIKNSVFIDPREALIEYREISRLGGPKERLIRILAKDTTIRQWFSHWIGSIIDYRRETSSRMTEFYDQITKTNENMKKPKINSNKYGNYFRSEEYNIENICIESI
jgi:DNA-binding MarR family transcriptional regulator